MSGVATAKLTQEAAKLALKAARKLVSSPMKSSEWTIHGKLRVRAAAIRGRYIVTTPEDNPLRLKHEPTGQWIVVPFRKMETDFASVPVWVQKLFEKSSVLHLAARAFEKAAFFHDQLYAAAWCWVVFCGKAVQVSVTKRQADALLAVGIECLRGTRGDMIVYHAGVFSFGGPAWRRCRKENAQWPILWENRMMAAAQAREETET